MIDKLSGKLVIPASDLLGLALKILNNDLKQEAEYGGRRMSRGTRLCCIHVLALLIVLCEHRKKWNLTEIRHQYSLANTLPNKPYSTSNTLGKRRKK